LFIADIELQHMDNWQLLKQI